MDQTVIDLGDLQVDPGEAAIVFGPGTSGEPTVADWATWAGTIEHEIVTGIGGRCTGRSPASTAAYPVKARVAVIGGGKNCAPKSPSPPPRRSPRAGPPATRSVG